MRKIVVVIVVLAVSTFQYGWAQTASEMHAKAKSFMNQGDYDNATLIFGKLIEKEPTNTEYLKDLAFLSFLKRDFAKSIELGKYLTEQPAADVTTFQILALAYKGIADAHNTKKVYKKALSKFPESGVLHCEYGEVLAEEKDLTAAINEWEQGIKTDANYSGNYFYAANYYTQTNQLFWVIMYGEVFVNLESYTKRTATIKSLMLDAYKKLYLNTDFAKWINDKKTTPFEKAIATLWSKSVELSKNGLTPESLTAIRTRCILDYFQTNTHSTWPWYIFNLHQFFLKEGLFEAYNQWLFGAANSTTAFQTWIENHAKDAEALTQYQRSRIFKMAPNQYYKK